ncbi:MAG: redoxin domain-containing protein [Planctomycetota bacterium]
MLRSRCLPLLTAGLVAVFVSLPAWGEEASDGRALLEAALDHLAANDRLAVEVRQQMHVEMPGMKQDIAATDTLAVDRPGRYALRPADDADAAMPRVALVSDGETLSAYSAMFGRYTQRPTPETLAGDASPDLAMAGFGAMVMRGLIDPAAIRQVVGDAENFTVAHLGRETPAGLDTPADRLRFTVTPEMLGEDPNPMMPVELSVDLWVAAEGEPWVLRLVPDMQAMIDAMARSMGDEVPPQMREQKIDITLDLAGWSTPEAFADDTFAFVPPEGAVLGDSLIDMSAMQGGGQNPADALVGQPAPAFTLATLDGGEVSLSDFAGQVVVLDFWATWCPPCVEGLPKIAEAVAGFADRDAVFLAVNQAENPDTIRAFLDKAGLADLSVPLDDGAVAQQYLVSGIPQTVVIDGRGVVRAVHVGFGPGGERQVINDLEMIYATPVLAPPTAE